MPRRVDYVDRRTDGYVEPCVVVLVGTAHVSRRSQVDVVRVIQVGLGGGECQNGKGSGCMCDCGFGL